MNRLHYRRLPCLPFFCFKWFLDLWCKATNDFLVKRTNQATAECNDLDTNASESILFSGPNNQEQHLHKLDEMLWTQWLENANLQPSSIPLHKVRRLCRRQQLLHWGTQLEVQRRDYLSQDRLRNELRFHQDQKWLFSHVYVLIEESQHVILWSKNQEEVWSS